MKSWFRPLDLLSILSAIFLIGSLSSPILAQSTGVVTGEVVDGATRRPLAGAQISIPGTTIGTVTNTSGRYLLPQVPSGEVTLRVQYLGYSTATEVVTLEGGATVTVDFQLSQTAIVLDEMVVTGVGVATERRKLGNTIATIDTRKLESAPAISFSELIQAREPGVMAISSGGMAGEGMKIRIRGTASLSQSNDPIVYVDGVRVDNSAGYGPGVGRDGGAPSRLDDINPASIARVEILKGAAAATLYGTEASNGVIQIFTKNGRVSDPRFDFKVTQSFINYPKTIPDNTGFARSEAQADTMSKYLSGNIRPYELVRENYVHQLFETGIAQEYSGSVSGGTEGINYFVNARWSGEDGPVSGKNLPFPERYGPVAEDILKKGQASAKINIFP